MLKIKDLDANIAYDEVYTSLEEAKEILDYYVKQDIEQGYNSNYAIINLEDIVIFHY